MNIIPTQTSLENLHLVRYWKSPYFTPITELSYTCSANILLMPLMISCLHTILAICSSSPNNSVFKSFWGTRVDSISLASFSRKHSRTLLTSRHFKPVKNLDTKVFFIVYEWFWFTVYWGFPLSQGSLVAYIPSLSPKTHLKPSEIMSLAVNIPVQI